jgi:PDZ domain-containing protein
MKIRSLEVWGALLLLAGLGLTSVGASAARADDEDQNKSERHIIRIERSGDDDSDSGSGFLGIMAQKLTSPLRRARNIPESVEGVLVGGVSDGGPADDAGIKRGDVILEVQHDATRNPSDLIEKVRGIDPGTRVPVLVWRDGARRNYNVTIGKMPAPDTDVVPPSPRWEGQVPNPPDAPGPGTMFRRRADLERQLSDLQDQLSKLRAEDARLEREIQELRDDVQRSQGRERDRDNQDRDQGNDEGD